MDITRDLVKTLTDIYMDDNDTKKMIGAPISTSILILSSTLYDGIWISSYSRNLTLDES